MKRLTKEQIERLKAVQKRGDGRRSYSIYNLRAALDAPFTWETLQRAMAGNPIQERNRDFLVQWLDRYVPASPQSERVLDSKSRAAGERDDLEQEPIEEQEPSETVTNNRLRDERIPREK